MIGHYYGYYAGKVLRPGMWAAKKDKVTIEALVAVCRYVLQDGGITEITKDGKREFLITVKKENV